MTNPVVLCVDDDPDMLRSVARILRPDGYTIVTADSPRDALTILQSRVVAVLVSDFEMPVMTGVELAVRARAIQPETVRILLTGRNTVDTITEGINVGEVYRFLAKPFEPDVLRREVAAAVVHHGEIAAVAQERSTVVRRLRLLSALEADFPGISLVPRDETGAYLLDGEVRHRVVPAALSAIVNLLRS